MAPDDGPETPWYVRSINVAMLVIMSPACITRKSVKFSIKNNITNSLAQDYYYTQNLSRKRALC